MKKIWGVVAALLLVSGSVFAEGWQKTLSADVMFPFGIYSKDDTFTEYDVAMGLDYFTVKVSNGLAVKLDFNAGWTYGGDLANKSNFGYVRAAVGGGWAPLATEKYTVAVLGTLGYYRSDAWNDIDAGGFSFEQRNIINAFFIGAEAAGVYRFTKKLGVYVDLGIYVPISPTLNVKYDNVPTLLANTLKDDDIDFSGFVFIPTIGISWTF